VTKGARVLIVEDEPALVRGLTDALRARGFEVTSARDGEGGLDAALGQRPDLMLLDIMVPRMNGYEVCQAVREQGLEMPILMLTAKGQEEDIILGLKVGADDYLTKPFKLGELMARIDALLRRAAPVRATCRFGDCEVDVEARTFRRAGRAVALTAKEFKLLAFFLEKPGRALSRDTILNAVWGNSVFVTPRSIDRCVTTLRAKLEPDPRKPIYIQTLRDIGYRFDPGRE
jgi:DNA-binding response OmpR family regulator